MAGASPSPTMLKPRAASALEVSVAWLVAPLPFTTETLTADAAGRGSPVIGSMFGPIPRTPSIAASSWTCEGNSTWL